MMDMKTLTARRIPSGEWKFTCPLHLPAKVWIFASSPNNAINILKEHMDTDHPGVKIRLMVKNDKFDTHTTYTAQTTVETGDLL
jgi:hypothetical protein